MTIEPKPATAAQSISTGLRDLDKITGKLHGGEITLVSGAAGMGKSTLCSTIAYHVACIDRLPVLYFSLDCTKERVISRLICAGADVYHADLRTGRLLDSEWRQVTETSNLLFQSPIEIIDDLPLNTASLHCTIEEIKEKFAGLSLVVIDNLQMLQSADTNSGSGTLSLALRELKSLARHFDIPLLVAADLAVNPTSRPDPLPTLGDLFDYRNQTALSSIPDSIIFLHWPLKTCKVWADIPTPERSRVDVVVPKQKHGPVGTIRLKIEAAKTAFRDWDEEDFK